MKDGSTKTIAEKWNIKEQTVAKYCREGYIPGAVKLDGKWRIPENAVKPPKREVIDRLLILINTLKHQPELAIDYAALGVSPEEFAGICSYLTAMQFIRQVPDSVSENRIPYEARLTDRGLAVITGLKQQGKNVNIDEQKFADILSKWGPSLISLAKAILEFVA